MIFTKRNYVCADLGSLDRHSHLSVNDCMFSMKDYLSWCCNSDTMRSHRHLTMTIKPRGRKLQNVLHKTGIAHTHLPPFCKTADHAWNLRREGPGDGLKNGWNLRLEWSGIRWIWGIRICCVIRQILKNRAKNSPAKGEIPHLAHLWRWRDLE